MVKLGILVGLFIFLLSLVVSVSAVPVSTCQDLHGNLSVPNAVELASDIDCAGYTWTDVGAFNTELNGKNFTIKNLAFGADGSSDDITGLVGTPGTGAYFHNFCMDNETIYGGTRAGGIVGSYASQLKIDQVCVKNSYIECDRTNSGGGASHCAAGGIYAENAADTGYNTSNCYVVNSTIKGYATGVAGSLAPGGVVGSVNEAGYPNPSSFVENCFSYGNTIIDTNSNSGGAFVGGVYSSYGNYIVNSFATYSNVSGAGGILTNKAFIGFGGSATFLVNDWFGNSSGETSSYGTGAPSNSFNNSYNSPLDTWDFSAGGVWKNSTNYPLFKWQNEPAPSDTTPPQSFDFSGNATAFNAPPGGIAEVRANWTDDTALGFFWGSFWDPAGAMWWNSTATAFSGNQSNYLLDFTSIASKGVWFFKIFANDTAGNQNVTESWNITITDVEAPQFSALYQNTTNVVGLNHGIFVSANWTDNIELANGYVSYWNTTHWTNSNFNLTYGADWSTFESPLYGYGNWSFKFYANDTSYNQNMTFPLLNVSVTAAVFPQWYSNYQSATSVNQGTQAIFTANFTDTLNLSMYIPSYWNTTHWVNSTGGVLFGTYCTANYTDCQTLYAPIWTIPGLWQIKFYANNTNNNWNVSPIMDLTVNAIYPWTWRTQMNTTDTIQIGSPSLQTIFVADTINLTHYINSYYNSSHWNNGTMTSVTIEFACYTLYNNCTYSTTRLPNTTGVWGWKVFFNNTFNNWNVTPMVNVTVIDTLVPTYTDFSGNTTNIFTSGSIKVAANWSDNYILTQWTGSWWNSTHWENDTPTAFTGNASTINKQLLNPGDWSFKIFASDSLGNENVTGLWNVSVTTDSPPYWNTTTQNVTEVFKGNSTLGIFGIHIYDDVNITVQVGYPIVQWTYPSGNSENTTANVTGCTAPLYTNCQFYSYMTNWNESGVYSTKWFFKDSVDQWNISDPQYVTSKSYPSVVSCTDNSTTPGSILFGGSLMLTCLFSDDINLTTNRYVLISPTGGGSGGGVFSNCTIANTSCYMNKNQQFDERGVWTWYMEANNTFNLTTTTPTYTIDVYDNAPQWLNYTTRYSDGTDVADEYVELGNVLNYTTFWSDDLNLSMFYMSEIMPNLSVVNYTTTQVYDCSPQNTTCGWTTTGTPSPIGAHYYAWFVNDSYNQWNSTPYKLLNITYDHPQAGNQSQNGTVYWMEDKTYIQLNATFSGFTNFSCGNLRIYNNSGDLVQDAYQCNISATPYTFSFATNSSISSEDGLDTFWWNIQANNTWGMWNSTANRTLLVRNHEPVIWNYTASVHTVVQGYTSNLTFYAMDNSTREPYAELSCYFINYQSGDLDDPVAEPLVGDSEVHCGDWTNCYTGNSEYANCSATEPVGVFSGYAVGGYWISFCANDTFYPSHWGCSEFHLNITTNTPPVVSGGGGGGFEWNWSGSGIGSNNTMIPTGINVTFHGNNITDESDQRDYFYFIAYKNSTGSIAYNTTPLDVGDYASCNATGTYCNLTIALNLNFLYTGEWQYSIFVNDSINQFSNSDWVSFSIMPGRGTIFTDYNDWQSAEEYGLWAGDIGYIKYTHGVVDPQKPVLFGDFDWDGQEEFILINASHLSIFEGKTLALVGNYPLYGSGTWSNIVIAQNFTNNMSSDIFVMAERRTQVYLNDIQISPTGIINTSYDMNAFFPSRFYKGGQIALGCSSQNRTCMFAFNKYNYTMFETDFSTRNTTNILQAYLFTKDSGISGGLDVFQVMNVTFGNTQCFPKYRSIVSEDTTGYGLNDYIFTTSITNYADTADDAVILYRYSPYYGNWTYSLFSNPVADTMGLKGDLDLQIKCYDDGNITHSGSSNLVSNVLVFDNNGDGTKEAMFARMVSDWSATNTSTDWDIYSLTDWDAGTYDRYYHGGDGGWFSNLVRMNLRNEISNNSQFCAYGWKPVSWWLWIGQYPGLMCGDAYIGAPATTWFNYKYNETYRVQDTLNFTDMIWSAQEVSYKSTIPDVTAIPGNSSEFIASSMGVMALDTAGTDHIDKVFPANQSLMDKVLGRQYSSGTIIPVPEPGKPYHDLLVSTPTYLYYIDDVYSDSGFSITNWEITPCIVQNHLRTSWQSGERVQIQFTVEDTNTGGTWDDMSVRATLYNGEVNEVALAWSNWTSPCNATSCRVPQEFTLEFYNALNWTTPNSTWTIEVRDMANTTTIYTDIFNVVDVGGRMYGECSTGSGYILTSNVTESNILKEGIWSLAGLSGVGKMMFWIIIIIATIVIIWIKFYAKPMMAAIITFIATFILALFGLILGMIGGGVFFLLMVTIVVGLFIMFQKKIVGGES